MISYVKPLRRLRRQLPFQGSLLDGLQVAPQAASPPAPLSGEPSISISCCLRRLRRQLPFQGSRLCRSVVASGGFAASKASPPGEVARSAGGVKCS